MSRFWIIQTLVLGVVMARRIGRGRDNDYRLEDYNNEYRVEDYNNDPVVAAEGKVLQKIKSDIYQLEKEEADVEMDIMNRLNHRKQRGKHLQHLGGIDDEDQYLIEGSGRRLYYAM